MDRRRALRAPAGARLTAAAFALAAGGCPAAAPAPETPHPADAAPRATAPAEEAAKAAFRRALELSLAEPAGLRLRAESYAGRDYLTVEVFGRGVGIWNGRRQFRASGEEIATAVRAALAAGFPEMPPIFGGEPRRRPAPAGEPAGGGPVRTLGVVEIEAGGLLRRVEQLAGGDPSPELLELAELLLALWRPAGEAGVGAPDLDHGLAMLARGELAAETLEVTLHEKPERPAAAGSGFLLRLRGRAVSSQAFASGSGYAPPRALVLTPEELTQLAGELANRRPGRLPANLWAPGYLDLTVELLGHRVAVQARPFAGMTRETHGAVQRELERLLDSLRALNARVLAGPPAG